MPLFLLASVFPKVQKYQQSILGFVMRQGAEGPTGFQAPGLKVTLTTGPREYPLAK